MKALQLTLAIICCHVLTGTASVTTRYLVSVLDPVDIAFMRYLFGGLAILPLFFIYRSSALNRVSIVNIVVLGLLFFALFPFLYSWALSYTSAARGSLILATMPVWTILISKLIGHEKVSLLSLISVALTLLGLTVVLVDKLFQFSETGVLFKGEFIMLLAAMLGGVYAVFSRKILQTVSASTMTPLAMLSGCLCLFPFAMVNNIEQHIAALSLLQIGLMAYLGVVAGGIAFFLFNWTLTRSTSTFATLFITLNPLTAIVLAYVFLGERISANFIVGVLIVFAGLGLAVKGQMQEQYNKLRACYDE